MLHSDVYTGLCCWLVCLRACAQPPARACSGALLLPKPRVRLRTGWQRSMAPSARAPHTGTRPSASCAVLDQVGVVPGVCVWCARACCLNTDSALLALSTCSASKPVCGSCWSLETSLSFSAVQPKCLLCGCCYAHCCMLWCPSVACACAHTQVAAPLRSSRLCLMPTTWVWMLTPAVRARTASSRPWQARASAASSASQVCVCVCGLVAHWGRAWVWGWVCWGCGGVWGGVCSALDCCHVHDHDCAAVCRG